MAIDGPDLIWGDVRGHLDPPSSGGGFGDCRGHLDSVPSAPSAPVRSTPSDPHLDVSYNSARSTHQLNFSLAAQRYRHLI